QAQHDDEEVPAVPQPVGQRRQLDEGRAAQALAPPPEAVELAELREPEGRLEVGESVVVARLANLGAPGRWASPRRMPWWRAARRRSARSSRSVRTAPPSPVVISFAGWKESVVMSARDPTRRSPTAPPNECAASAMTIQPFSRASGSRY